MRSSIQLVTADQGGVITSRLVDTVNNPVRRVAVRGMVITEVVGRCATTRPLVRGP